MTESVGQVGLGLFRQSGKGGLVKHSQISQNLAIDLDRGLLQTVNHTAVGQAIFTGTGIDTGNPQGTELTLALLAIPIGILARLGDCLGGNTENIFPSAAVTLGLFNNFLVFGACGNTAFTLGIVVYLIQLAIGQHAANHGYI